MIILDSKVEGRREIIIPKNVYLFIYLFTSFSGYLTTLSISKACGRVVVKALRF
jgi:hypothetical protein